MFVLFKKLVLADAPVSLDHHYSFKDTELKNGPQIQNKVPHPIPAYTCNLNPYVVEQLTIEDVISNSPYKDPHSVSVISESAL